MDGRENSVDDLRRRLVSKSVHDLEKARGRKLLPLGIHRFEHAVSADDEQITLVKREGDFVVRGPLERPERNSR